MKKRGWQCVWAFRRLLHPDILFIFYLSWFVLSFYLVRFGLSATYNTGSIINAENYSANSLVNLQPSFPPLTWSFPKTALHESSSALPRASLVSHILPVVHRSKLWQVILTDVPFPGANFHHPPFHFLPNGELGRRQKTSTALQEVLTRLPMSFDASMNMMSG